MFLSSNGLNTLTDQQYQYLFYLLSKSFHTNPHDLILSMLTMNQFFLLKNNKPIAVVSFHKKGPLHCSSKLYPNILYNIATAPHYRKKGYMKQLLQHVLFTLKKQRRKYVHLEVLKTNIPAIHLYEKLGFKILDDVCNENIYLMKLDLTKI